MDGFIIALHVLRLCYEDNTYEYHVGDYSGSTKEVKNKSPSIGIIIGSSNGLICSLFKNYLDRETRTCAYDFIVMNPSTGEHVNLPRVYMDIIYDDETTWGFGWHPYTNEYKVVGINCPACNYVNDVNVTKGFPLLSTRRVQVYTLGSGTVWREKRDIGSMLEPEGSIVGASTSPGFLLDGCLHWLKGGSEDYKLEILSFELGDEKLVSRFPLLQVSSSYRYDCCIYELGVLGRSLCVNKQNNKRRTTSIWILENKLWVKKFKLRWDQSNCCQDYRPIAVCGSGKFLVLSVSFVSKTMVIAVCDSETGKLERIKKLGDTQLLNDKTVEKYYSSFHELALIIIPHSKSFVSLKALMGNARTI